jgi:sigma-B regulation protein RsbU (phosphoserine phosphatase)
VHDPDPAAVLHTLNTVLLQEYRDGIPRFCTVLHGLLEPDRDGCTITLASGGHPPAIHIHHDGTLTILGTPGGHLVGALPHAHFTTIRIRLDPGDTVLLYTDGLIEARPNLTSRTRYSEKQLHDFLTSLAPTTAPAIITALTRLLADFGEGVDDDTALLALGIPPHPGASNRTGAPTAAGRAAPTSG